MLELVVRLAVVLLLFGGAVWAWRRSQGAGLAGRPGPALRVVGRAGLTRSSLVAVVEADGRRFLVGAAEQGVQLLAALGEAVGEDASEASVVADGLVATGEDPSDDRAPDELVGAGRPRGATDLTAAFAAAIGAHGRGTTTHGGPRIGPHDRLRGMTVRSHIGEPIRVIPSDAD